MHKNKEKINSIKKITLAMWKKDSFEKLTQNQEEKEK